MTRLTFIGKPDCHLCEDARTAVDEVLAEFPNVELIERSILDEPELFEAYVDEIPVLLIDDRVHTIWRVDAGRLRGALAEAANSQTIDTGTAPS
ncbi:MAG: glutaredoxin family protein [Pseudolysinimonas sp.]